ncbi:glycosyltransferase [Nocardioidaceae bacterium]|nr:glycosyltransferase [Nocardioidaceae bacterium]
MYVRHLAPLEGDGPRRLPDPVPRVPRPQPGQWWPPAMLSPTWVAQAEFDVFHLHFGFDAWEPSRLAEVVDAVHARGRPFVFTVHDLRNPHHVDRALHDAQLDVLVPAAEGLVTLTEGAAAEIRRRWDREATVIPHPHVVDLPTMEAYASRPRPDGPFRVGVHAKSLRASMDPDAVLPALARAVGDLPDAVLQVNVHTEVMEGGAAHAPTTSSLLRDLAERDDVELHVHDFLPDADLWAYLASLDLSVLPYRFGTHSGWLEACRDVGTTVLAPSCGFFADQGPVLTYGHDESGLDEASLTAAVRRAYDERPRWGATVDARRAQRAQVTRAYDEVYADALDLATRLRPMKA